MTIDYVAPSGTDKPLDWIVLKFDDETPNKLWCKRCGEMFAMPHRASIDMTIVIMKQFAKEHQGCLDFIGDEK